MMEIELKKEIVRLKDEVAALKGEKESSTGWMAQHRPQASATARHPSSKLRRESHASWKPFPHSVGRLPGITIRLCMQLFLPSRRSYLLEQAIDLTISSFAPPCLLSVFA